jgi:hypothetical protein
MTFGVMLFQVMMVRGKKEKRYTSARVYIVLKAAIVRPSIEYASAVWDPFNKNQIFQLDSVQRRAARFASNNFQDREPGAVTSIHLHIQWMVLLVLCMQLL